MKIGLREKYTHNISLGTFFHIYIESHIGLIIIQEKKEANKNHADIKYV